MENISLCFKTVGKPADLLGYQFFQPHDQPFDPLMVVSHYGLFNCRIDDHSIVSVRDAVASLANGEWLHIWWKAQ